jgi:hypothetical protein
MGMSEFVYLNGNSGEKYVSLTRVPRLDRLTNWTLQSQPEPEEPSIVRPEELEPPPEPPAPEGLCPEDWVIVERGGKVESPGPKSGSKPKSKPPKRAPRRIS